MVNNVRKYLYVILGMLTGKIKVLDHNQVPINKYPDSNWSLVPFPSQKGKIFNFDNLATVNKHDFLNNDQFRRSTLAADARWQAGKYVRNIKWRLHIAIWAFGQALNNYNRLASQSESIFVECGTGRGYMAAGISDYYMLGKQSPRFLLFDRFKNDLGDGRVSPADFAYTDNYDEVKNYFKKYQSVEIINGDLPSTLSVLGSAKVSFLHLDLNHAESEQKVLNYLQDKFNNGCLILLDDFGGPGGEGQAKVHIDFFEKNNRDILQLPTGQGLVIW